jgi:hypothetical protein
MGLIMIALPLDLLIWLAQRILGFMRSSGSLSPTAWAGIWLAATLAISGYAMWEADSLRVERVTIHSPHLAQNLDGLKIVQISDLHLSPLVSLERVRRVADMAAKEQPDLIVSTGDLVDGMLDGRSDFSNILSDMPARLGKYAVTGNHERHLGERNSVEFTGRAGFSLLRGQLATPAPGLCLAGMDDPAFPLHKGQEAGLVAGMPADAFLVMLKHRPEVDQATQKRLGLQLSGHAHRGQIFPYNFLVGLVYPRYDGLYDLGGGAYLYTSRGTGSWGPPMRLLAPPELTVITLRKTAAR